MKLPVLDTDGKEVAQARRRRLRLRHRAERGRPAPGFVTQRNNQRAGTANTKTRGEVQGSTRKIRMQKYTGRARQGSARAPTRVGGGIVFGPHQRDYARTCRRRCGAWPFAPPSPAR